MRLHGFVAPFGRYYVTTPMYCMLAACALFHVTFITVENSSKAFILAKNSLSYDICILIPMGDPIGQSVSQIVSHFTYVFYPKPTLIST